MFVALRLCPSRDGEQHSPNPDPPDLEVAKGARFLLCHVKKSFSLTIIAVTLPSSASRPIHLYEYDVKLFEAFKYFPKQKTGIAKRHVFI